MTPPCCCLGSPPCCVGWMKFHCLVAGGEVGGDTAQLLGGVLKMSFGAWKGGGSYASHMAHPDAIAPGHLGQGSVLSGHCVCPGLGSARGVRIMRLHPHSELVGDLGVQRAGLVATAESGVRNQSVVAVPSLLRRAPR
jgi:hypothetical protein